MKILFLDIDGCLNSKQDILMQKEEKLKGAKTPDEADFEYMKAYTDPKNVWCLKYIMDKVPDLAIVISSAWRNAFDMELFKELFKHYGLDGERIIGKTPKRFSSERVHEIHEWLDEHKDIEKWLALDDHPVFNLEDCDKVNELLTDSWVGLTMQDAFKVIKHFKPEYEEPVVLI
jgi:hypothetical protein